MGLSFSYATGGALKGGAREYRAGPWYGSVGGMSQADRWMGEANQRAYGYGSYADEPPRFTTIEQSMTALRQWMGQQLKEYPAVANPMNNQRIRDAMSMLEHELGRSPVKEHLPRALAESEIADMIATAKVTKQSAGSLERPSKRRKIYCTLRRILAMASGRTTISFWILVMLRG